MDLHVVSNSARKQVHQGDVMDLSMIKSGSVDKVPPQNPTRVPCS